MIQQCVSVDVDVCSSVVQFHVFGCSAVAHGAELAAINSVNSCIAVAKNYGGGR